MVKGISMLLKALPFMHQKSGSCVSFGISLYWAEGGSKISLWLPSPTVVSHFVAFINILAEVSALCEVEMRGVHESSAVR